MWGANWKGKKLLNKCQQLSLRRSSKSMELKVRFCPIFIFLSWIVYDWDFQLSWSLSKPDGLEHGKWLMTLGSSTQYKPNLLSRRFKPRSLSLTSPKFIHHFKPRSLFLTSLKPWSLFPISPELIRHFKPRSLFPILPELIRQCAQQ